MVVGIVQCMGEGMEVGMAMVGMVGMEGAWQVLGMEEEEEEAGMMEQW